MSVAASELTARHELRAFLRRAAPIRTTLVALVLGTLLAALLGAAGRFDLRTLAAIRVAIVFGIAPCYQLWRGAPSLLRVWRGDVSRRTFWLVIVAGVFVSDAYEALNADLQFHVDIGSLPIDKHPAGAALTIFGEPLTEELFFQVGLQTWLERFGSFASIIIASLLFSAVHATSLAMIGSAMLTHLPGFVLIAVLWRRTRSLGICVLVHAGYNATLVIFGTQSP